MWNLERNDTNELNLQNRLTDLENKLRVPGEGWEAGRIREFGIDRYTLLYLKWITNNVLLYSTANCSMLCGSLDGRGVWGENGYMYMYGWVTLLTT